MRIEPGYIPTPKQIADACRFIRDNWSASERQRRLVGPSHESELVRWSPPRIDTSICNSRVRKAVSELTA